MNLMNLKKFINSFEIDKRSGYTIVDVIRILRSLSEKPKGRIRLMNELGLGEATVKTVMKRLGNEGVLKDSTRGRILTKGGLKLAGEINRRILVFPGMRFPSVTKNPCAVFVVRNPARKVRMGIEQRDEGMKIGADVITLVYDGKNVRFPGTGEIVRDFGRRGDLKRGDIIIISSGECKEKMERGGIAAALTLI